MRKSPVSGLTIHPLYGTLCAERDIVDIEIIKAKVRDGNWVISSHADQEAADESIDITEIRDAILGDEILEQYADTGR